MKKNYFPILLTFFSLASFGQIVTIPDANFKNVLLNTICADLVGNSAPTTDVDMNNDGEIQVSEALLIRGLDVKNSSIASLDGIASFSNLRQLDCSNNNLQSLDLNGVNGLRSLRCSNNFLTTLNLSNLSNLGSLNCGYNQLSTLDINALNQLEFFTCNNNQLTSLNISNKPQLGSVLCPQNQLTTLSLVNVPGLYELNCSDNLLTSLNVPSGNSFETFICSRNLLTALDLTSGTNDFWWLDVSYNQLANFIVPRFSFDGRLNISGNLYTSLSFLPNSTIISFTIDDTNLVSLDLSNVLTTPQDIDPSEYFFKLNNNPNLQSLNVKNGQQQYFTSFYISNNPVLTSICADVIEVSSAADAFGSNATVVSDCTLGNQAVSSKQVTLTPNPTTGILNVHFETGFSINEINLYNPLGQLVKTLTENEINTSSAIDVSALKTGTYFMEIVSDGSKTIKKFVKL
ncbi:T9SS type A sorting domain-containing protein [Flavobacterium sp.]|uniref:T9SS type A sorting domain-containing protein n=1 Tax=Flavobacterium sp. TaxID=239 RepID=UPI002608DC39|nr:T9SS type A sorting domain-containing protein [Flavobacterium sp.]